ncbi:MAG: pitrilysin family protein [Pseudomonadota bacterium]
MTRYMLALCLIVFGGSAAAQGVTLPDPVRVELDNGTTLILIEKHDVPLIGLEATVAGGAVADPPDKHGLANLLAGLLSKGAGERSAAEFVEAAEAVGGEIRAAAGREAIYVSADFMAKDAALMVELLADMLRRPTLAQSEFAKLRERSINLIKSAKSSDPSELLSDYANAFLFGDHAYGNPPGGSEASLAAISRSDVVAYYNDHFGGDRLTVAVSGDFDAMTMQVLLTEAFGDWEAASGEPTTVDAPPPAAGGRVYLVNKPDATQTYFSIGNVGVARNYAQRAELDLANTVFGGRFTSMLVTELRTKSGLSYSARSSLARHRQPGSVFITSFTETGTTVAAIDVALATLGQFQDAGLDDEMLLSARNYVMGQYPPRFETAAQIAGLYAMLELYGLEKSYVTEYGANLTAATTESIAAVIDEVYPAPDELVFVLIGDAEKIREQVAQYGDVTEIDITEPRFHP